MPNTERTLAWLPLEHSPDLGWELKPAKLRFGYNLPQETLVGRSTPVNTIPRGLVDGRSPGWVHGTAAKRVAQRGRTGGLVRKNTGHHEGDQANRRPPEQS